MKQNLNIEIFYLNLSMLIGKRQKLLYNIVYENISHLKLLSSSSESYPGNARILFATGRIVLTV